MSKAMDIIGKRLPLQDALMKVTGRTEYLADMTLPRMLHAKMLYSTKPHAYIVDIDTSEAEKLPGVKAVITYKNSPDHFFNSNGEDIDHMKNEQLFNRTVRYIGDRVAAVAAVDEKTANAALKLIKVEYEDLPAIFDVEEAFKPDALPLHEGGNILTEVKQECGNVDEAWDKCDYVIEDRYETQPIHHAAIEFHAAISDWKPNGHLTVYTPNQDCYHMRQNLSELFGVPMSMVRVSSVLMGGAFGGKIDMEIEAVTALLSKMTSRPVKMVWTRKECIISARTRHAVVTYVKTGFMKDGTIVAQDIKGIYNAGAYATGSNSIVWASCGKVFKISKIPNIRFAGYPVMTNSPVACAMRGFGGPQIFFALQRQYNKIAKMLGMDMVDIQMKNLVDPDDVDPRFGAPHGNAQAKECLKKAVEMFDWYAEEEACRNQDLSGDTRIGVGLSVACHGSGMFGAHPDLSCVSIKMNYDGTCVLYSPCQDMGNGSISTQKQLISSVTGISLDNIRTIFGDTDLTSYDFGCYGSRGTYVSGMAALKGAQQLKAELAKEAGALLGCAPEEVDFHDDCVFYGDKSATMAQVMDYSRNTTQREISVFTSHGSEACPIPYGAHIAKVEVNIKTGETKVLKYAAVHDVGKILNPLGLEGQLEGGIVMGMGQALIETCEVDDKGNVKNNNFRSYKIMKSTDLPKEMLLGFVEGEAPIAPYGAKSIGECCVVPTLGAIGNAVANALDVETNRLPLNPQRILGYLADKQ